MISKLVAIASNTYTETIRQPIFSILLWTAAGLLTLNPAIAAFSLESGGDNKVMKDIALSTLLLYGLLASVFSATSVITREIESFTVLTVVSKPVSRPLFLCGKQLGVTAAIAVGFYFLSLVFLMASQHGVMESNADKHDMPVVIGATLTLLISLSAAVFGNYVYGWHFPTTMLAWAVPLGTVAFVIAQCFDKEWNAGVIDVDEVGKTLQVAIAIVLIFLAVMVLTACAVALSTRFSQVLTLVLCAGIFVLGLLSDYYFGLRADEGMVFQVVGALLPNFQYFWVGDALTQDQIVPLVQVARVAAYAGLYTLGVLALGVAMFQTREVG